MKRHIGERRAVSAQATVLQVVAAATMLLGVAQQEGHA